VTPIIGIDLGTTNSAIGIFEAGKVRLLPNPLGDVLTPSAVALDTRTNTLVVGRTAKDLLAVDPSLGAVRFKIDMGSRRRWRLGTHELDAIELSAHLLDALRADAERALGTTVNRCVVTVPAYFDDSQRHATRRAAELAGFAVERILNEPTAAAIAYGLHKRDDESVFAIVDLGGGTFDVCVMELFEGVLQVKGVAGESRLGGEDFTEALAAHAATVAGVTMPAPGAPGWGLLFKRAELAKRALSRWTQTELQLPSELGGMAVPITAADADAAWAPLIERIEAPLRAALRGAGVPRDQLAEVVLVGGATRMKAFQRTVAAALGREPIHHADPDLLVAEGAAIQAAMIADDRDVGDLVITDVASHSLGVDTSREIGGRHVDGYFAPIIHRNTVIPTTQVEAFSTLFDDQAKVDFGVYEGEARRVADNRKIGQLIVDRVPKGRAPKVVQVRFTYDLNGMLEVEATVMETGKVFSRVFHREGKDLDGTELETARGRLRALRADPMDRPRYRDLLARAKLLWADSDPAGRALVDPLLDAFDAAVHGRNPKQIEDAYGRLLAHCERHDRGDRW